MSGDRVLACVAALASTAVGAAYTFGDPSRSPSARLAVVGPVLPLWGALFLADGLLLVLVLWLGSADVLTVALLTGGVFYAWWAAVLAWAAFTIPTAPLGAWALYLVVSVLQLVLAVRVYRERTLR